MNTLGILVIMLTPIWLLLLHSGAMWVWDWAWEV